MADGSKIEWTEATWQPVTGCSVVSPGCRSCYAMKLAGTRLKHHPSRAGLTQDTAAGPIWTGEVRLNGDWLRQPLQWKRPRLIFVCAHGDLFHEAVPDEWIDRVFAVMALTQQHTYQVLTKRADRMLAYMKRLGGSFKLLEAGARSVGYTLEFDGVPLAGFPLPNVWIGVSVEDQKRADERIPLLLKTPAAVRWVSCEPLLGPVYLRLLDYCDARERSCWSGMVLTTRRRALDWVVVGAESGPRARPMDASWARSLRDQCGAAGVPIFIKQLSRPDGGVVKDMASFPSDLRIQEYPQETRK